MQSMTMYRDRLFENEPKHRAEDTGPAPFDDQPGRHAADIPGFNYWHKDLSFRPGNS